MDDISLQGFSLLVLVLASFSPGSTIQKREVQTYVEISHPVARQTAAGQVTTSSAFQVNYQSPVLPTPQPGPVVLLGAAATLSAPGTDYGGVYSPPSHPSYPAYPGRNAALDLERGDELFPQEQGVSVQKAYRADTEYPPLDYKDRKRLYSVGFAYALDFLGKAS
ncbi:uncharacterized protein LOC135400790 [Ornithodoros turicata]|uniref:uncharacterized protein LOC135400790 n=1 Tax=Ornithodoros turicata TaxID=34597 RepID=UPI00313925E6